MCLATSFGEGEDDQVGRRGRVGRRHRLELVLLGQPVVIGPRQLGNNDLHARIPQVLSVGVALAAVADDGHLFALEEPEVSVLLIVNVDWHGPSILSDVLNEFTLRASSLAMDPPKASLRAPRRWRGGDFSLTGAVVSSRGA
jgi:hypothetical protein